MAVRCRTTHRTAPSRSVHRHHSGGVHVSIISPLVNDRAAHHWSQAKLKTEAGLFQRLHWPAGSASRLAFSQPAIVVRSVVPSSNFPESGRAARATTIIPPFGATSTPICPTRELPVDKPDLLPGRRGKQLHIKSEEGDYILGFESSTSSLHGHWFRIGDPNFGDGFTLPLNTPIGVVSRNRAHVDLFAVGKDTAVYTTFWDDNAGGWHGHWFRIGDPNFGDGFTLPLNTSIGVVSCNPA